MKLIKFYDKQRIIFLDKEFEKLLTIINENNFFKNLLSTEFKGRNKILYFNFLNQKIIVRENFHGGLFSFLKNKFFFYSRFINEFLIHNYLYKNGFLTTKPVGIIILKKNYYYQSFYLTIEIEAKNLYNYLENKKIDFVLFSKIIEKFYELIFKYKIFHNDLQVKNILINNDEILIIDFNKSKKIRYFYNFFFLLNIFRLYGSLKKNKLIESDDILNNLLLKYNYSINKYIKKILEIIM